MGARKVTIWDKLFVGDPPSFLLNLNCNFLDKYFTKTNKENE